MAYYIAAASSDGEQVDRSFGAAEEFWVYEVAGPGDFRLLEIRRFAPETPASCGDGCGSGSGCGNGNGNGNTKIALIGDCRSVLCTKAGLGVQKELQRRAITLFDVACPISQALDKIAVYFDRVDRRQSLRDFHRSE